MKYFFKQARFDKSIVITALIAVFLLFPIFFIPITPDLSTFLCAGKVIADGGIIYHDFIDIKPPFIYYFFSVVTTIFGVSDVGVHFFDFLWQSVTVISLIWIIIKISGDKAWALASGLLYSILYAGSNYVNVMQAETFIALPMLWAFYFQSIKKNKAYHISIIIGILLGFIASFKYTFALIVFAFVVFELFNKKNCIKSRLAHASLISLVSLITFGSTLLVLLNKEAFEGFQLVLRFYSGYQSIIPLNLNWIIGLIKLIPMFTARFISFPFFVLFIVGCYIILKSRKNDSISMVANNPILSDFIKILGLSSVILFFSVIIERKLFEYHHYRYVLPLIIILGLGTKELAINVFQRFRNGIWLTRIILILFLAFFVSFSSFARWVYVAHYGFVYFTDRSKYNAIFEMNKLNDMFRVQQVKIASSIKNKILPDDKVCVIGTQSNIIYLLSGANRFSRFAHSAFYFSVYAPEEWKKGIGTEIRQSRFVALQHNLANYYFHRHNFTNIEMIEKDSSLKYYFSDSLIVVDSTENFLLYEKKY